jgi:hypothetical protein
MKDLSKFIAWCTSDNQKQIETRQQEIDALREKGYAIPENVFEITILKLCQQSLIDQFNRFEKFLEKEKKNSRRKNTKKPKRK